MKAKVLIGVAFLALAGMVLKPASGHPAAQENATATPGSPTATAIPTATPTAYTFRELRFSLLAQADINVQVTGNVLVSAATITLAPGAATIPFQVNGPTVIAVQAGKVTFSADDAAIGVVDIASVMGIEPIAGTPVAVDGATITTGQQVYLPTGATGSLRNDESTAATLLILSVAVDAADDSTPEPTP